MTDEQQSTNCGERLASLSEDGLGYFFTSLGFLKAEHLEEGLFIGGRCSTLVAKTSVQMKGFSAPVVSEDIAKIVDDCDLEKGSKYCGPEIQAFRADGRCSFLRYMNLFSPNSDRDTLWIYTVKDIPKTE